MSNVPEIIYSPEPELTEFVDFAWKLAFDHVTECPGAPQTPYMDEAFAPDRIWIWDTCFMSLYCKYSPDVYPGIQSLRNFYEPMLNGTPTPLKIHIPDNPPLFAWVESEYYRLTNDKKHLNQIFFEQRFPQKMFEIFEQFQSGQKFDYMSSLCPVQWEKTPIGYHWSGGRCGMDNTPRGDFPASVMDNDPAYRKILFLDAISQQALAARIIYEVTGEETFQTKYQEFVRIINQYYWDPADQCYYDIEAEEPHRRVKVMTPASFWPLLAGTASREQAEAMAKHAENPEELGGPVPFPSVARNSPHFDGKGGYWRGGVWLPTAYMAVKSLEKYGFFSLADRLAGKVLLHQYRTWKEFEPHTIWETYSPNEQKPATLKNASEGSYARPDFCGWSALGPINFMIENVLGISVNAPENTITWRIHHTCRHGIKNLKFGDNVCSLMYENGKISRQSKAPFRLIVKE